MNILRRIFFFLFLLTALNASARKIVGNVVDEKTHEAVIGATIELLSPKDSTVLFRTVVKEDTTQWGRYAYFTVDNVSNNTEYVMRISAIGYVTKCVNIKVRMGEKVATQYFNDFTLKQDSHMLNEVVVKATKIKMVMHGDTVVYNADAFQLSQGSMLDALIRQLPGATIKNGVISINGREVSSLLIDGRDFFKGDAKKALENLPAYAVDKVKTYEKSGQQSRLMGKDMGDKEYVLDVNLKKEYHHGLMGNFDVALGTNSRYSGRGFLMAYTKKDRLTLAGSTNNVNDHSIPGNDYDYGRPPSKDGKTATKLISLDYRHEGKTEDDYRTLTGSLNWSDDDYLSRTTSQTYLTGGDTYGLSRSANRNKARSARLEAGIGLNPKNMMISASTSLEHSHGDNRSTVLSGSFSQNPSEMGGALDSLFMPQASSRLMSMAINRVRNMNRNHNDQNRYNLDASLNRRFGAGDKGSDLINVSANGNYTRAHSLTSALNQIDYLQGEASRDHRNQYADAPQHGYNFSTSATYTHSFTLNKDSDITLNTSVNYQYSQGYDYGASSLYRLDQLADYMEENFPLGMLPSNREDLLTVMDATNSYRSEMHESQHTLGFPINFTSGQPVIRPQWSFNFRPQWVFKREHLRYYRNEQFDKERNDALFSPVAYVTYNSMDSTAYTFLRMGLSSQPTQPSLTQLLTFRDDANPLYVRDGNSDLKNGRNYNTSFNAWVMNPKKQNSLQANVQWNVYSRQIANAIIYDRSTGITHSRPVNVSGNWSAAWYVGSWLNLMPKSKTNRLFLAPSFSGSFRHAVDFATASTLSSERSTVNTIIHGGGLALYYDSGENRIGLEGNVSNQHVTSRRAGFQKTNAWDNNIKLNINWNLPWHFQISTDLTDYIRSGYNDEEMNSSQWVWNMRLTRKLLKDRLAISLDGFDILNQLKNNTYTVNETGRTETWTNSLPRYLMLHVAYKFTIGMQR